MKRVDVDKSASIKLLFLVQVQLMTEVLCTPNSTQPGVRTHDLQIMTVHFMSLRRKTITCLILLHKDGEV